MSVAASSSTYATAIDNVETLSNLAVLLQRALCDPAVLFYGSIIVAARRRIAAVVSADGSAKVQALLEVANLLASGTYSSLPQLTEAASKFVDVVVLSKLRQLTVLSVVHDRNALQQAHTTPGDDEAAAPATAPLQRDEISYKSLACALAIDLEAPNGLRLLEDTLLDALSNNLLAGKLNRKQQFLWVRHGEVEHRDVVANPTAAASQFNKTLTVWLQRCDEQLVALAGRTAVDIQDTAEDSARLTHLAARQAIAADRAKELMLATTSSGQDLAGLGLHRGLGGGMRGTFSQKRRDYGFN